ncbi:MAG: ABC transporter permease [Gemmatimonadetes bacterium]|nr:ABC transporter permease [Gemmatimonadota bacterium]
MHRTWVVIRREFLAKVRNKWFLIATLLGPALMGLAMFLPAYLLTKSTGARTVTVVDASSDQVGRRIADALDAAPLITAHYLEATLGGVGDLADSLAAEVGRKVINGFLLVTDQTITDGDVEYRGSNVSSQNDMANLQRYVEEAVLTQRLERVGVDPRLVADARLRVDLRTINIRGGKTTEQSGQAAFFLAYVMWFVLYIALVVYGQLVAGAVVEEKSSRIIEVLVSSLRPSQLLAGKVIGVGAVGLFQLLIWAVMAKILIDQQGFFLDLLGIRIPGGRAFGLPGVPLATMGVLLLYFVLGFFLYATMFAAVGAMSSSDADVRQAQQPVLILIVIPALLAFGALNDPDGPIALTLTLVPFSSPIAMPIRWSVSAVPLGELAASVGLLVVTMLGVTWVAARIYRVGILMYGKRPGLRELARWVRTR